MSLPKNPDRVPWVSQLGDVRGTSPEPAVIAGVPRTAMSDAFTVPETRVYRVGRESRRFQKGDIVPRVEAERLGMIGGAAPDDAEPTEAESVDPGRRMGPGPAENRMGRGPAENRAGPGVKPKVVKPAKPVTEAFAVGGGSARPAAESAAAESAPE